MHHLSALIATDFSGEAEAARRRAASIAGETGLHGAIVHVVPPALPADLQPQAASQAQEALALLADEMRRDGLRFEPRLAFGEVADELAKAARHHDMIIAGARGEDLFLDFALGRTSTRLVHQSDRPVLIVKHEPDEPYRRVLATVDFSEASFVATALGLRVAPTADLTLLHAYEVEFESRLRRAGAREDSIDAYRHAAHEKAMQAMSRSSSRLASRAPVGSVSLRALETAQCDVLIVPERAF